MGHRGSVQFAVMFMIFVGAMMVLGTGLSIHQINQKKVIHTSRVWQAMWSLKSAAERWTMGLDIPQEKTDFIVDQQSLSSMAELNVNQMSISWKEGDQSKRISLIAYKPVIP